MEATDDSGVSRGASFGSIMGLHATQRVPGENYGLTGAFGGDMDTDAAFAFIDRCLIALGYEPTDKPTDADEPQAVNAAY